MGIRNLGECLDLPRDGLARRFGPGLIDYLDRALGRIPDPRPRFVPPECFERSLDLDAEANSIGALLFPLRRLLMELGGFLTARGLGVQTLDVTLRHAEGNPSRLRIGLVSPSRDIDHLLTLAREHLDRRPLQAPVVAVGLIADQLTALEHRDRGLFGDAIQPEQDWSRLIERLQGRLGSEQAYTLSLLADHRPERAWERCTPGNTRSAGAMTGARPVWLLEPPQALQIRDGHPWLEGRLELLLGPERIESGWWDGGDIRRDYYVAEDTAHGRLWLFRQSGQTAEWFLHGIFA
jgi:protein ImuB